MKALPAMSSALTALAMVSALALTPSSAKAADGCKFLLCIAGPWASIPECRATVYEVFSDLAKGKAFPSCAMSGEGNGAGNLWMSEATCPILYRRYNDYSSFYEGCAYMGKISVVINGAPWSDVYWNTSSTATWYSQEARASMSASSLDETLSNDIAAWNAGKVAQCQSSGGTAVYGQYGAFEKCNIPDQVGGS